MTPDLFGASPLESTAAICMTAVVGLGFLVVLISEGPSLWYEFVKICRALFPAQRSNVVPFPAQRVDDRPIHQAVKQVGQRGWRS